MAGEGTVGESQLQRIIRDLHEAVAELSKEYRESGEPITDDSSNLHKFSYKLEYLLQFDQKEKSTFLGTKKDYWDYFNDCLAKVKGANDGIRFVKCITELKTSLGKGRAFIRYSLVHQRLADTLQQCLMNQRVTSDWYYARSPFLKPHLSVDIINHLYELNEVQFDVASRGHDLDASWPTFARRTLGCATSPGHMWKPPSRSSSINSLASSYSQHAPDFPFSPDYGQSMLNDLNESLPPCREDVSTVEDLRLELDQSELKHRALLDNVQQFSEEAAELRGVVVELQRQLDASLSAQEEQQGLQEEFRALQEREKALIREVDTLRNRETAQEAEQQLLQKKLAAAEGKNIELMAKLDGVLNEKGHQAASFFDSAQKIHELLDRLKEAEKEKMDAVAEGEERKRQTERLEEELRVKEAFSQDAETKLGALVASASEEKVKLEAKVEQQITALDNLQGALTLREKETSNLQKQLQDLQDFLEKKESELQEVELTAEKDKDEMQKSLSGLKKSFETEVTALEEQLQKSKAEITANHQTLQQLEAKNQTLTEDRDKLTTNVVELEGSIKEQGLKMEEYKMQCASLMELNEKLLATVKRNEELMKEMAENRLALENESAALRSSEKHLRGQLDDAKMTVDEKEKHLREENRKLDESLQRSNVATKMSETTSKRLEKENQSLREEQDTVKAALGQMQADLKRVHGQIGDLEKNLGVSRKNEASLQEQLQAKDAQLDSKEKTLAELQSRVRTLETREKELEKAKADVEETCAKQTEMFERVRSEKQTIENAQLERSASQAKENQEVKAKLTLAESQLEVSLSEVSRLQSEIVDLKVDFKKCEEKKLKLQAQLEVTEAQRNELRTLTEQLKAQTEALNQSHITELMECKKKEEALNEQRDKELAAHAELAISTTALREELATAKAENAKLASENSEVREGLHRANTEMAELGMTICRLGAEKEEVKEHWQEDTAKIEELVKEMERIEHGMEGLQLENDRLREELTERETLPESLKELQKQLDRASEEMQKTKDSSREETEAIKFQMSSESMNHQLHKRSLNEQLDKVKAELQEEMRSVSRLEARVSELEAENEQNLQLLSEKDARVTQNEATISEKADEITRLADAVSSAKEAHLAAQKACAELKQKLSSSEAEKANQLLTMSAEIDDLNRTKTNLEERLIELIRDKDALWQKSDALEFEQKLRAEERWWLVDKEITHCLDCQSQFSWWLRRHHCRLCGRIFCYYCSSNYVMTKQSGKKERCCKECYTEHSAVVERFTAAELSPSDSQPPPPGTEPQSPPEPAPYKPTPRVTVSEPSNRSDDGAFDIITEEEVNGVYDSDTTSQTISLDGALNTSAGDMTPDDPEDHVPTVQDLEINLLKSGEITLTVPLSIDDISGFGDGLRELFIKSSSYSVITIEVSDSEPTISWMFSSEPKSISFSVVYRESADTQVEQSKVLIPLTRCSSHKETIKGQLKVRQAGLYSLVFDNSFSRFISKKVFYHLTMEKPIIYDGSDFP